jgi:FMN phosphatase YigB (HAD superfamily)
MNHFYRDVPGLGNVAVSRHAQARAAEDGISQEAFDRVLLSPLTPDVPDGLDVLWRERDGIRLVILTNPTPNNGAKLIKTLYRVEAQAKARP